MSYGIALTPEFMGELRRLPPEAAEFVLDQVELLALNPVGLSRRVDVRGAFYQAFPVLYCMAVKAASSR